MTDTRFKNDCKKAFAIFLTAHNEILPLDLCDEDKINFYYKYVSYDGLKQIVEVITKEGNE